MTVIDNNVTAQRDPTGAPSPEPNHAQPREASPGVVSQGGAGAKDRIMATANELFYHEGIRAVGVDRLISESRVTKATFYKHFGAKETLVVSYVNARHDSEREVLSRLVASSATTEAALHAIVDNIVAQVRSRQFRGCAFINAATEFPDGHHVVREVVSAHRDWYTAFMADLFRRLGHPMPGDAADEFVLLRDGTMSGGYASDPIAASAAMQRCVSRLLRESHPQAS
ncbi:MAG TPA: TetR/AcrR family transcriptional regulator [Homoserinimonas sp.]|nr:TetR/AcrR family transcriptional regulator [Homoserinimonas sp.]